MKKNEKFISALITILPEAEYNPMVLNRNAINTHFDAIEFSKKQIFSQAVRERNDNAYATAHKLAQEIIPLINLDGVKLPEVNSRNYAPDTFDGMVTLPYYSPKQNIKAIQNRAVPFERYLNAADYSAIFQAALIEAANEVRELQTKYLTKNPAVRLKSTAQRVQTYFRLHPEGTIYDCADKLGLMPIQVIHSKDVPLSEVHHDECDIFVLCEVTR
jgi:hypothetical protein